MDNSNDMRDFIIKKSTELFINQGYNKTTIRQIAEAVNLGRGHLYYYFKKKEDILIYLFKNIVNNIYSELNANLEKAKNPLVRYAISEFVYINIMFQIPQLFRIYIESLEIDIVRKEYISILNDFFKSIIKDTECSFSDEDIELSTVMAVTGGAELLSLNYSEYKNIDLEKIAALIVRTRLLLLDINNIEVKKILEEALIEYKTFKIQDLSDTIKNNLIN